LERQFRNPTIGCLAGRSETIYLVMDNAGGHGTNNAVEDYTRCLKEEHNITIIQQPSRSPHLNALDLEPWTLEFG